MATKKSIKGIQRKNAEKLLEDLHAVLEKYNLDYSHFEVNIDTDEFSLTKSNDLICDPPCVIRYEVIILPNGKRQLRPYCDCPDNV